MPLGDRLAPRRLVVSLLGVVAVGLIVAGTARDLAVLIAASALVGASTVVPQIIIPMAVGLAPDDRRGAVTGTLLSGLIGGILLARAVSGVLGAWLGWRAPYLLAAGLAVLLAGALAGALRATDTDPDIATRAPGRAPAPSYPSLLATTLRLLRTEPELRRSCTYQVLAFGGFSAAWTSLTLLVTGSEYGLGTTAVAGIALVGAGSMLVTPAAGRMIDRRGPEPVTLWCTVGLLAAAALLTLGDLGAVGGLAGLALGMLALDVAVQAGQVANQARVFALAPRLRARLNTAYMCCAFLGGSVGSWLGVQAYGTFGWNGVCLLVALLAGAALVRHLLAGHRSSAPPRGVPAGPAEPVTAGGGGMTETP